MRSKNQGKAITSFTDLKVWQKGHQLVLLIYKETKHFPREEQFGLTLQIRRAVVSFTSNLAEGFSRNTYKDKLHFYCIALGSLTETQNQLLIAKDIGLLQKARFDKMAELTVELSKMTNGLIKKTRSLTLNS
jgi:four helix bundle protein